MIVVLMQVCWLLGGFCCAAEKGVARRVVLCLAWFLRLSLVKWLCNIATCRLLSTSCAVLCSGVLWCGMLWCGVLWCAVLCSALRRPP